LAVKYGDKKVLKNKDTPKIPTISNF